MLGKNLNLLINAGGTLLVLFVVGYVVWSSFQSEQSQSCTARYPAAMRFSLQSAAGKPLTAAELQARAGLRDLGVVDNAAVVTVEGGPSPEALEVKLRKLPDDADKTDTARNGIEFHWSPSGIEAASSACLSYSVWLPADFHYGGGGFLPGVIGGEAGASRRGGNVRLTVTPEWSGEGQPMLMAAVPGGEDRRVQASGRPLPLDRWIRMDVEVVLNKPGEPDGAVRLWIDGSLTLDATGIVLRSDDKTTLTGVLAGAGYRRSPDTPGLLRLSPLDIAWK
jgi:hypothetical protein